MQFLTDSGGIEFQQPQMGDRKQTEFIAEMTQTQEKKCKYVYKSVTQSTSTVKSLWNSFE